MTWGPVALLLVCSSLMSQEKPRARDLYLAGVGKPLGLRYQLLKVTPEGEYAAVDPAATFRSGDRVRLVVESNRGGYLYVVHRGSSQTWTLLSGGAVEIQAGSPYAIPKGGRFFFDEQPGVERLFLVLSSRPEPNLDELIRSLRGGAPDKPVEISDAMVSRIRGQTGTRDLVFQREETKVYVVSTAAGPDSRVVVDLSLRHDGGAGPARE